jgi:non-canonical (house-cleaning) NTP pyrophosphatase
VIVYLGSTRPAKVDAAREALEAVSRFDTRFDGAELRTVDLGNVGPRMPMTEAAIISAAARRVRVLIAGRRRGTRGGYLYMGLEGGLDPVTLPDGHWVLALKNWACVSDGRRWSYGAGGAILLPDNLAAGVAEGAELGDVVERSAGAGVRNLRGAWGVLTRDLVTRRDAFRTAIIGALAPFFNAESYESLHS